MLELWKLSLFSLPNRLMQNIDWAWYEQKMEPKQYSQMLLKDIETSMKLQIMFMYDAFILLIMQIELTLLLCSSIIRRTDANKLKVKLYL